MRKQYFFAACSFEDDGDYSKYADDDGDENVDDSDDMGSDDDEDQEDENSDEGEENGNYCHLCKSLLHE